MALFKTKACVVQAFPFKDYDKRVVMLTEDYGKVVGIARGAKRSKKRFGSGLESLTLINAVYFEKQNQGLVRFEEVQVLDAFPTIKQSVHKLAYGSYFLELISEVMSDKEGAKDLFQYLLSFLKALETSQQEELLSRLFEARLLPRIGWQPYLTHCLSCKTPTENLSGALLFSFSSGGILCRPCQSEQSMREVGEARRISKEALVYFHQMISRQKNLQVNLQLGREIKTFLPPFLFHQLGKELRSYRFIQNVVV